MLADGVCVVARHEETSLRSDCSVACAASSSSVKAYRPHTYSVPLVPCHRYIPTIVQLNCSLPLFDPYIKHDAT